MPHRITVEPSGRQFEVETGNTILRAALTAGIALPYGCRNGVCGLCKGRVIAGRVDRGLYSEGALSEAELAQGYALFCCARPLSDLVVASREAEAARDMPPKSLPARVQEMTLLAPDVMRIRLRLPANERLQFRAGQYVDILLKDGCRRSFSLANAPHSDALLELHVRRVPGGRFTVHVFETMRERDILRLEGPHGAFYLREDGIKPAILLAGGTGFAPIKSLVEHAFQQKPERSMRLYWGARDRAGLYLHEMAAGWADGHPAFGYVPVLSEPAKSDDWRGRTGLVHQAVMADYPDLSGHQVYACGTSAMIEAARNDLTDARGLKRENFFADSFTFATEYTRS